MSKYKRVKSPESRLSDEAAHSIESEYADRHQLTPEQRRRAERNLKINLLRLEKTRRTLSVLGRDLYPQGHHVKARSKRGWTTPVKG